MISISETLENVEVTQSGKYKCAHISLSKIILFGQCIGDFPVCGVKVSNPRHLRFSWKSFRVWYSLVIVSFLIIMDTPMVVSFWWAQNWSFHFNAPLFDSLSTTLYAVFFFGLAKNWSKLMRKWHKAEELMSSYGFPKSSDRLMNTVVLTLTAAGLTEHLLYKANGIAAWYNVGFEEYIKTTYAGYFKFVIYSWPLGILVELYVLYATTIWNYTDIFMIALSLQLSGRYKQIAERVEVFASNNTSGTMKWLRIREDYNRLCDLCRTINDATGHFLFLMHLNTSVVLLMQLYQWLKPLDTRSTLELIYIVWSLGYLLLRACCFILACANVHAQAVKPLSDLLRVHNDTRNVEVERFIQKIQTDPPALTGKRFFKIDRMLLFDVLGAIINYELILLQYD